MKCSPTTVEITCRESPPSRGAWIEILEAMADYFHVTRSPPSRGAWIEMAMMLHCSCSMASPPSRGAWIEILKDF